MVIGTSFIEIRNSLILGFNVSNYEISKSIHLVFPSEIEKKLISEILNAVGTFQNIASPPLIYK